MADVKITALPASSGLALADLVPVVDDPAGAPVTQKATFTQVRAIILPAAIGSDVSGLGAGVATFLGTPSGANLAAALTSPLPNTDGGTGQDSSGWTGLASVSAGTWSAFADGSNGQSLQVFGGVKSWRQHDFFTLTNTATGTQDDVATTTASGPCGTLRWAGTVATTITSLASPTDGRVLRIYNAASSGEDTVTLEDGASTGTAANRLETVNSADIVLYPKDFAIAVYDATTARWRVGKFGYADLGTDSVVGVLPTGKIATTLSSKILESPALNTAITGTATSAAFTGNARCRPTTSIANVQTTDATVTTAYSYTAVDECTTLHTSEIVACRSTGAETAAYVRRCRIKRDGGTVSLSAIEDSYTSEEVAGWDATVDNSTSTIRDRVTGEAAKTIDWGDINTRIEVTHA